jgi:hypothetical protein
MHAPQRPVAPLRFGAAAVAQWASRGIQPGARRSGELLLSRGRTALASLRVRRTTTPAAASAAAAAMSTTDWGVHGESTNVVHLTGLRLFADEARTDARGVAPAAAVAAVLRAAAASVVRPPPAAIVITGDVAADGSAAAYALAQRLVRAAFPTTPVLFLPGCVNGNAAASCAPRHSAADSARAPRRRARRPGDDAAEMARTLRPDFIGPAANDPSPVRLLFPMPAGAHPSSMTGLKYGWRVILLPAPQASAGGLDASLRALQAELEDTVVSGARTDNSETTHVLLVLPTTLRPTAGCGGGVEVDDWGNETAAEPEDPDPLCRCLDRSSVRVLLHGGETVPLARNVAGSGCLYDTPAASGGDAGDARPGYRVVSLTNYHSGSYTCWDERV